MLRSLLKNFHSLQYIRVLRGTLAVICRLPPSEMAILSKTASDTRVDMPCRAFLVLCRASMLSLAVLVQSPRWAAPGTVPATCGGLGFRSGAPGARRACSYVWKQHVSEAGSASYSLGALQVPRALCLYAAVLIHAMHSDMSSLGRFQLHE